MKPLIHAKIDVKQSGGKWEDYIDIHEFLDSSYVAIPDVRHRALLHNQFGLMLVEQMFGSVRVNSEGKEYSTRDCAERHILADVGFIPTVEQYFKTMEIVPWMSGTLKKRRVIKFGDIRRKQEN